jgi:hypothetical protein
MLSWPPNPPDLRALIQAREGRNIEFKELVPTLSDNNARGEFVRDILALANSTTREVASYLLMGVRDSRRGGGIVGIGSPPISERVAQLLSEYTSPIPDARVTTCELDRSLLGVIGVFWVDSYPCFALRNLGSTLHASVAYIRRDTIVGTMTPPEIAAMIRAQGNQTSALFTQEPLQSGFVAAGSWSGGANPILRVTNVSDTVVRDVDVLFDVTWRRYPGTFKRQQSYTGAMMPPGESREAEVRIRDLMFPIGDKWLYVSQSGDRWIDITAHVRYRDFLGVLRQSQYSISIGD